MYKNKPANQAPKVKIDFVGKQSNQICIIMSDSHLWVIWSISYIIVKWYKSNCATTLPKFNSIDEINGEKKYMADRDP